MAYFAGIDGGGSQTICVVADEQCVLGSASRGTSKLARVGEEQARLTLLELLGDACAIGGIAPAQLDYICLGMSGAGNRQVASTISRFFESSPRATVEVVGDVTIALEAAVGDDPGAVVIAGTGSIAYGRNGRGELARAGGWGPEISDEGSGSWIGRCAVASALRTYDSGADSPLLHEIINAWRIKAVFDLVALVNRQAAPDYATLFPVVLNLANHGDAGALRILRDAGIELANLALLVLRRLWNDRERPSIFMAGGVFCHSELTRDEFTKNVRAQFVSAEIRDKLAEPVLGALSLARKSGAAAMKKA